MSKINGVKIDNAKDLDVVISMYSLHEYSKIYKKTTESLLNYHRYKPRNALSFNFESFKYKTSVRRNTYDGDDHFKLEKMKLKLLLG